MQGLMQAEGRWHCIIMGCMGQKWVVWQSSLCSAHRCTGMWIGTLPRWPCNELKYCCWLNIDSEQSWVCFALLYLFWAHSPSLDQQVFKHKNVRALQSSWLKAQLEKLHRSSQRKFLDSPLIPASTGTHRIIHLQLRKAHLSRHKSRGKDGKVLDGITTTLASLPWSRELERFVMGKCMGGVQTKMGEQKAKAKIWQLSALVRAMLKISHVRFLQYGD